MDINQLIIAWAIVAILALGLDIGVYLFLRAEWKKSGILLTDKFLAQGSDKLRQFVKAGRELLLALRPKQTPLHQPSQPIMGNPVEIIPVSVKTIGQVRRVQFSMDMAMNTTVNVRIGSTKEAGVKVEKREL